MCLVEPVARRTRARISPAAAAAQLVRGVKAEAERLLVERFRRASDLRPFVPAARRRVAAARSVRGFAALLARLATGPALGDPWHLVLMQLPILLDRAASAGPLSPDDVCLYCVAGHGLLSKMVLEDPRTDAELAAVARMPAKRLQRLERELFARLDYRLVVSEEEIRRCSPPLAELVAGLWRYSALSPDAATAPR
jgi:hypothetical protein